MAKSLLSCQEGGYGQLISIVPKVVILLIIGSILLKRFYKTNYFLGAVISFGIIYLAQKLYEQSDLDFCKKDTA